MTEDKNDSWIRLRLDGDPKPKREYCARCEQSYLPENLSECVSCHDPLCYACTVLVVRHGTTVELVCICGACKTFEAGWWNDWKPETPGGDFGF